MRRQLPHFSQNRGENGAPPLRRSRQTTGTFPELPAEPGVMSASTGSFDCGFASHSQSKILAQDDSGKYREADAALCTKANPHFSQNRGEWGTRVTLNTPLKRKQLEMRHPRSAV
jgi:hypothetical protein